MLDETTLQSEARTLTRYVSGRDPSDELIRRYADANRALPDEPTDSLDVDLLDLVRSCPRLLPLLDAATALLRPRSALRRKLVLMTAILEATPAHVDDFEPGPAGRLSTVVRVTAYGCAGVAKAAVGTLVYLLVRTTRPRP